MKKVYLTLLGLFITLLIVIIVRTLVFSSLQIKTKPEQTLDFGIQAIEHLSKAITFPTISLDRNSPIDTAVFRAYHQFLNDAYPLVNRELKKEFISKFSLLYTWKGSDESLKPIILMAHMDVVPAEDADLWTRKPFSGAIDEKFIWGRGSLDDKASMISILEAVEKLLSEKFKPERTIYLAFGHDEEIGGTRGAEVIASVLEKRGVKAEYVLDEGMAITQGMVPMVKKPVALIGTAEKGQMSVILSVEMEGGHSSTPEKETSISVLSKALNEVLTHPMKSDIVGSVNDFIKYIGPEMPFYAKVLFANKWLFKGIILSIYKKSGSGNALVSTTIAPTILRAGSKENILPVRAEAVINFRILPGTTSSDVVLHLKKIISDPRVKVSIQKWLHEPSEVSPVKTLGFKTIHTTISQVYPEALVAPTLMLASSDSKSFGRISKNIYKFAPLMVTSKDMASIHGVNEKNTLKDFNRGINFYFRLLKKSSR